MRSLRGCEDEGLMAVIVNDGLWFNSIAVVHNVDH